nr:ATPase domain-containing protein [Acidilobus saccharovorans]
MATSTSDEITIPLNAWYKVAGSIRRGSIILVAGYPGAGKTTLASQFAYQGASSGEPSLYVSFVEPREDFMANALQFNMDFRPLEGRGLFRYYEALSVSDPEALGDVVEDVLSQVDSMNAKRVVIDSVTAVEQLARDPPRAREIMHSALYLGLKRRGATALLISELPVGQEASGLGPEEFIVDGIIVLRYRVVKGKLERYAEVRKMRGTNIKRSEFPIAITPRGVEIVVPPDISSMPSGVKPRRSFSLLGLRIPEGANILVAVDPSVDPLKITTLLLASSAISAGLKVVVKSFIHGPSTIRDQVSECVGEDLQGKLLVPTYEPSSMSGGELLANLFRLVEDFKPDVVIDEGNNVLLDLLDRDDYTKVIYGCLPYLATNNVVTFHIYLWPSERVFEIPLAKFYDFVISVRPVGDLLEVRLLKTWGEVLPGGSTYLKASDFTSCDFIKSNGLRPIS